MPPATFTPFPIALTAVIGELMGELLLTADCSKSELE
jgi:hypothetical protein